MVMFAVFLLCAAGVLFLRLYGEVEQCIAFLPVCCPFHLITGIPCPGCGMTRAFLALAKGDLITAFHYNPFSLLLATIIFLSVFGVDLRVWYRFGYYLYSFLLSVILLWWFWVRVLAAIN